MNATKGLRSHWRTLEARYGRWPVLFAALALVVLLLGVLTYGLSAAINYLAPFIYVLV